MHVYLRVYVTLSVHFNTCTQHAFYVKRTGETATPGTLSEDTERWVVGLSREDAQAVAATRYPGAKFTLCQDEDVLDTWCVFCDVRSAVCVHM